MTEDRNRRLDALLRAAWPDNGMAPAALDAGTLGRIAAGARRRAMTLGPETVDLGAVLRRLFGLDGQRGGVMSRVAAMGLALAIGAGLGTAGVSPLGLGALSGQDGQTTSAYEGLFSLDQAEDRGT